MQIFPLQNLPCRIFTCLILFWGITSHSLQGQNISNPSAVVLLKVKQAADSIESKNQDLFKLYSDIRFSPLTFDYKEYQMCENIVLKLEKKLADISSYETVLNDYMDNEPGDLDVKYKIINAELIRLSYLKEKYFLLGPLRYFNYEHRNSSIDFDLKIKNWATEEKQIESKISKLLSILSSDKGNYNYKAAETIFETLTLNFNLEKNNEILELAKEISASSTTNPENEKLANCLFGWNAYINLRNHLSEEFKNNLQIVQGVKEPESMAHWYLLAEKSLLACEEKGADMTLPEMNFPEQTSFPSLKLKLKNEVGGMEVPTSLELIEKTELTEVSISELIKRINANWRKLQLCEKEPGSRFESYINEYIKTGERNNPTYFIDGIKDIKRKLREEQMVLLESRFKNCFEILNEFVFLRASLQKLIEKNPSESKNYRYLRFVVNLGLKYIISNKDGLILNYLENYRFNDLELPPQDKKRINDVFLFPSINDDLETDLGYVEKADPANPLFALMKAYSFCFSDDLTGAPGKLEQLLDKAKSNISYGGNSLKNLLRMCKTFSIMKLKDFNAVAKEIDLIQDVDFALTYKSVLRQDSIYKSTLRKEIKFVPFYIEAIPVIPFIPEKFIVYPVSPSPIRLNDALKLESFDNFHKIKIGVTDPFDKAAGKNRPACNSIKQALNQIFSDSQRFEIIEPEVLAVTERQLFSKEYIEYFYADSLRSDTSFIAFKSKFAAQNPTQYRDKLKALYKLMDIYIAPNLNSIQILPGGLSKYAVDFNIWLPDHEKEELKSLSQSIPKFDLLLLTNSPQIERKSLDDLGKLNTFLGNFFPPHDPQLIMFQILSRNGQNIRINAGKKSNVHIGDMGAVIKPVEADLSSSKLRIHFIVTEVTESNSTGRLIIKDDENLNQYIFKSVRPGEKIWFR